MIKGLPKTLKLASIIILSMSILYMFSTLIMLSAILIFDNAVGDLANSLFLNIFPMFGYIPLMLSCVSVLLFYVALRVLSGSQNGLRIGIVSLLTIPISTVLITNILMNPMIKLASRYTENADYLASFRFGYIIIILTIIALGLLFYSAKKFQYPNVSISKRSKVFLVSLIIFFLVPVFALVSLRYIKANDKDFGYNKAQSQVDYHVYKSRNNSLGLVNASSFINGKELAGQKNAINVLYGTSLRKSLDSGEPEKLISITQTEVSKDFDLNSFASTFMKDSMSQSITIPNAKNKSGILLRSKEDRDVKLVTLLYLTNDNILVVAFSWRFNADEIVEFVSSLE